MKRSDPTRPSAARAMAIARGAYQWANVLVDPIRLASGPRGLVRYVTDWRQYRALPGAEKLRLRDAYPCVHDRTTVSPFDAHYTYQNHWAATRLLRERPSFHVDVGGQIAWNSILSAAVPVAFIDVRPLVADLAGLSPVAADACALPLASGSVASLSCLHVAEHVGLGRYGDRLDPAGSERIVGELQRVLAPGGHLLFSVPVGRPRVCFNAHRVLSPTWPIGSFRDLELVEFAVVGDDRRLHLDASPEDVADADYACGLYCFKRPL